MYKVEPEMRIIRKLRRGFEVQFIGARGLPDFIGTDSSGLFCAVEVKGAPQDYDKFPCSWVKEEQRNFMVSAKMPCYIGVMWPDSSFELFDFKPKGSYKKGKEVIV